MSHDDQRPVIVTGEALVDLVLEHDGSLTGHPRGGPYNVARTIGRLDQPVVFLGRVSSDGFGSRLRRELELDGVRTDAIVATDAPTTLALAELDHEGVARYHVYDAGTSAPGLTLEEATAALPRRIATFYDVVGRHHHRAVPAQRDVIKASEEDLAPSPSPSRTSTRAPTPPLPCATTHAVEYPDSTSAPADQVVRRGGITPLRRTSRSTDRARRRCARDARRPTRRHSTCDCRPATPPARRKALARSCRQR